MKKWGKIYKTKLIHNFEEFGKQGYEEWVRYADFEEPSLEELAEEWFEWDKEAQPVLIKARKGEILIQKIPKEWEEIKVKITTKKGKEKLTTLGELYKRKEIFQIWDWFLRKLLRGQKIMMEELIKFSKIFVGWKEIYETILTITDVLKPTQLNKDTIKRMIEILIKLKIDPNEE